ncbi:MAG: DUF3617 family protein, partial [Asticcacaulis sp.]|nr:DUF3617 family protein [Asticcacaulis sp.]
EKPAEPMNTPPSAPGTTQAVPSTPGDGAQQWQASVSTRIDSRPPLTTVLNVCVAESDPEAAANRILSQYCGGGAVTTAGNTMTWQGQCRSATASGQLTFSDDRRTFTGDVMASRADRQTRFHVDARVTGSCATS